MSLYDYKSSKALDGAPFHALLMAAMRGADSGNARKLREAFPETWAELDARYNAPGGLLPGEHDRATGYRRDGEGNLFDERGEMVRAI